MNTVVRDTPSGVLDVYGGASPIGIRVDARSGTLVGLLDRGSPDAVVPGSSSVALVWGGAEQLSAIGGLEYTGTDRCELTQLHVVDTRHEDGGDAFRFVVTARDGDWELDFTYSFTDRPPHVGLDVTVRRADGAE